MSDEILSRLERIDHKEYSCGFEFADSSTFDEMARCFEERKILAKEIERLNNILKKIDDLIEDIDNRPLVDEDMFGVFYNEYQSLIEDELRGDSNGKD